MELIINQIIILIIFFIFSSADPKDTIFSIGFEWLDKNTAKKRCGHHNAELAKIDYTSYHRLPHDQLLKLCPRFSKNWINLDTEFANTSIIHKLQEWVHHQSQCFITDTDTYDDNHSCPAYICEKDFNNPCESNPCLNGGICCIVKFKYNCSCKRGTSGDHCQKSQMTLNYALSNSGNVYIYVDGKSLQYTDIPIDFYKTKQAEIQGSAKLVAFKLVTSGSDKGFIASYNNGWSTADLGDWRCTDVHETNNWKNTDFNDSNWNIPKAVGNFGMHHWVQESGISTEAEWIWTHSETHTIYCRHKLPKKHHGNFSITYKTDNYNYTQPQAKSICETSCATCRLADIEDDDEMQKVLSLSKFKGKNHDYWLGGELIDNKWIWNQDNRPAVIKPPPSWISSDISEHGNTDEKCLRLHKFNKFMDIQCTDKYGYICEGDFPNPCEPNPCGADIACTTVNFQAVCSGSADNTGDPDLPNVCEPNPCLGDGLCSAAGSTYSCYCKPGRYGDNCEKNSTFSISYGTFDHSQAKQHCESHNSQLANIDSLKEMEELLKGFKCNGFMFTWIDVNESVSRKLPDGLTWAANNPNRSSRECVSIDTPNGHLGDRKCYNQRLIHAYACEGGFTNPCDPNPCFHGGTCCVIDFNYTCSCTAGSYGEICQDLVTCPIEKNHSNVIHIYDRTTFRSILHQTCVEGYREVGNDGNDGRVCKETGQWSGVELTCELITCPHIENDSLVLVNYDNVTYNSTLYQNCVEGYKEVGKNDVRICIEPGEWSGEKLTCELIRCPDVTNKSHILLSYENTTYNSMLYQQCVKGYRAVGMISEVRVCNQTGQWSGEELLCELVTCPTEKNGSNVILKYENTTYGSNLHQECVEGYKEVRRNDVRVCNETGQWSGEKLICELITCPHVQNDSLVLVNYDSVTYNSTLYQNCIEGYKEVGKNDVRVCNVSEQWSGEILTCELITCPHLRNTSHVLLNYENTTYNTNLYQQCVEGYKVDGKNDVRVCNKAGQWSGEELTCESISCSIPTIHSHTQISSKGMQYLDKITYHCGSNYTRKSGNHTRVCQANGNWSGTALVCQEKCDPPPKLLHTTITKMIKGNIEIAIYQCTYGYKMVSGLAIKECRLGSSMWNSSGADLKCEFAPNNDIIVLPEDPKPNTTKERIMATLGMLEVDIETPNITVGSVAGIVFISITIAIILSLDITMKKDIKRMKRNLRYKLKNKEKFAI